MKYRIRYELVVIREIEADNMEDADTDAWDMVPYPEVGGKDGVTSADCETLHIEAICLECGEGFELDHEEDELCDRCFHKQEREERAEKARTADPTCVLCETGEEPGHEH